MLNNCAVPCDAGADGANHGEIAMKVLDIVPRHGSGLYSTILKKQADIRKSGRGTFVRGRAKTRGAARWTHVRYKGSLDFKPGETDAVSVRIRSSDHGDEARLLSSFLGWLDRHFGKHISSVTIQYR
jgi:hypothetical protein